MHTQYRYLLIVTACGLIGDWTARAKSTSVTSKRTISIRAASIRAASKRIVKRRGNHE